MTKRWPLWTILVLGLLGGATAYMIQRPVQVSSIEWLTPLDFDEEVTAGDQPLMTESGFGFTVSSCELEVGQRPLVEARIESPYEETLAYFAVSVDAEEAGTIWGFLRFEMPEGKSQVRIAGEVGDGLSPEEMARQGQAQPIECGLHFLGFKGPPGKGVAGHPVVTRAFDN